MNEIIIRNELSEADFHGLTILHHIAQYRPNKLTSLKNVAKQDVVIFVETVNREKDCWLLAKSLGWAFLSYEESQYHCCHDVSSLLYFITRAYN